jgi:hypothetical protein
VASSSGQHSSRVPSHAAVAVTAAAAAAVAAGNAAHRSCQHSRATEVLILQQQQQAAEAATQCVHKQRVSSRVIINHKSQSETQQEVHSSVAR